MDNKEHQEERNVIVVPTAGDKDIEDMSIDEIKEHLQRLPNVFDDMYRQLLKSCIMSYFNAFLEDYSNKESIDTSELVQELNTLDTAQLKLFYDKLDAIESIEDIEQFFNTYKDLLQFIKTSPISLINSVSVNYMRKGTDKIEYPVDTINNEIWRGLQLNSNGQRFFNTGSKKKNSQSVVLFGLLFKNTDSNVSLPNDLTFTDKWVLTAVASLGMTHEIISLHQIYYNMGYDGTPNARDLEKINNSLTKMRHADLLIDTSYEDPNCNYPRFVYDGSMLPFERLSGYVNGVFSDSLIHLLKEPPLIEFARLRGQITTLDRKYLCAPLSKTNTNLAIQDYLLERISQLYNQCKTARGRNKVINNHYNKILFSTIFDYAKIPNGKERGKRFSNKIEKLLLFYSDNGFITNGYTLNSDNIVINV